MKKTIVSLFVGIFAVVQQNYGQQQTGSNNIWLHYVGKNGLTSKTSVTLEASMRYADGFNQKQQWFVRPSLDYQFSKKIVGSIGFTQYNTYVYGDVPLNKINTPESHVWVQGIYTHTQGNFKFVHRLRDENRFVGVAVKNDVSNEYEISRHDYRNRVRYMFLVNYALMKSNAQTKLFAVVGDEAFLNVGSNAGKTLFNQNRVIAGLGYNVNSHHQVQLNYIHQQIWNFGNTIVESNPTLRLSYITSLDFYKK
ncbi:DUF2490 domain-containing protein [Flavobacterium sp. UMI-01]|uniref:DUF2490 domain-containing protein n=1 Tax=Flavobacterium sp. UMI-01 TaxID=1441053 RepID=UPI001C7D90E2|nr:DUF2490 domain-containing protein [Flavobacterium sp. UMI-01]GIZ08919.1 hypothetical protein FUMI01_16460 [Flavobacterium sp. UMI-01]